MQVIVENNALRDLKFFLILMIDDLLVYLCNMKDSFLVF